MQNAQLPSRWVAKEMVTASSVHGILHRDRSLPATQSGIGSAYFLFLEVGLDTGVTHAASLLS